MAEPGDFGRNTLQRLANADPWKLERKLASGNPAEIGNLAAAFAKAGGDEQQAAALKHRAQSYTSNGYQQDGSPIGPADQHAQQVRKSLSGGTSSLRQIAAELNSIATSLHGNAYLARNDVEALNREIKGIETEYHKRIVQENRRLQAQGDGPEPGARPPTEADYRQAAERIYREQVAKAVPKIKATTRTVQGRITGYEGVLRTAQRRLSTLGYVPPAGTSTGSGPGFQSGTASGARDGAAARAVITSGRNDSTSLHHLREKSRYAAALAQKGRRGEQLTQSEREYLKGFYQGLGQDGVDKYAGFVNEATPSGKGHLPSESIAEGASVSRQQPPAPPPEPPADPPARPSSSRPSPDSYYQPPPGSGG